MFFSINYNYPLIEFFFFWFAFLNVIKNDVIQRHCLDPEFLLILDWPHEGFSICHALNMFDSQSDAYNVFFHNLMGYYYPSAFLLWK